jgi:hypothetical protein
MNECHLVDASCIDQRATSSLRSATRPDFQFLHRGHELGGKLVVHVIMHLLDPAHFTNKHTPANESGEAAMHSFLH